MSFPLCRVGLALFLACVALGGVAHSDDPPVKKDAPKSGSYTVGPEYAIDPDLTDRENPKGKLFELSMKMSESKIFRGKDKILDPDQPLNEERSVSVYIPAAYKDGTKAPILVTFDGNLWVDLIGNALDNLTISKNPKRKLPAFILIAVANGGGESPSGERSLEYDTMSDRNARFIETEVLPFVLANAEIKEAYPELAFTDDPDGRAVMGCSSGGTAAMNIAWFRPDLFRRVIAYSGSFTDYNNPKTPERKTYPFGAWEYHSNKKLIEKSEKKPLRIFTHVAERDANLDDPEETHLNWVMANQRMVAALKAKGYDYRHVFSKATEHCDGNVFEHTLADTLIWIWQGYEAK